MLFRSQVGGNCSQITLLPQGGCDQLPDHSSAPEVGAKRSQIALSLLRWVQNAPRLLFPYRGGFKRLPNCSFTTKEGANRSQIALLLPRWVQTWVGLSLFCSLLKSKRAKKAIRSLLKSNKERVAPTSEARRAITL